MDSAQENMCRKPFSPPRHIQWPGPVSAFQHSLPLSPLIPPPHPYPRPVHVQKYCVTNGPHIVNECRSAQDRPGRELHQKYPLRPHIALSPSAIRVGITLVLFLCHTVPMRDFLCKVYDKLYGFLGYNNMRLILGYESGGKGFARISFYL